MANPNKYTIERKKIFAPIICSTSIIIITAPLSCPLSHPSLIVIPFMIPVVMVMILAPRPPLLAFPVSAPVTASGRVVATPLITQKSS